MVKDNHNVLIFEDTKPFTPTIMLTQKDIEQIESRGTSRESVESQIERFKKGFPWMKIAAPATPGRGILVLDEASSSLDAQTEQTMLSRIFESRRGKKTIICITHREAACAYADDTLYIS